jgi:predicted amidophosphoribosyltransferase
MLSFLFKYICIFCDDLTGRKLDLCVGCEKDLPFLENCCAKCAQKLPAGQMVCGSCLNNFSNITTKALFEYQIPVDQIILNFKFHDGLIKGNVLSVLFAEHLYVQYKNEIKPELIIPVPLHKSRLRKRGYNQALEIARPIAKKLNIPIDKFSVIRGVI